MITINTNRMVTLLDEAVAERGADYVDPNSLGADGCNYVVDDKPGCIAGLVFHKAGVSIDTLSSLDLRGSMHAMSPGFLRNTYDIDLTERAYNLLKEAQTCQDESKSWGDAVDRAKTTHLVED